VFCAVAGVEPQSETVWRQADKYRVPRIAFVNKMDRVGADFYNVVDMMRTRLGAKSLVLQIPIGKESEFMGMIDVVSKKAYYYDEDSMGSNFREVRDVPEEYKEKLEEARESLFETLSEYDDSLMSDYLDGKDIAIDKIKSVLRKAVLTAEIFPVFCGSAFKNKGVQLLLDSIIDYLPSPAEVAPAIAYDSKNDKEIEVKTDSGELGALVFKIMHDPYVGELSFVRVYSGELRTGAQVFNSNANKVERIGRLLRMHANKREDVEVLHAGSIGAVVGLKHAVTGSTLCSKKHPFVFETMSFPEPVISIALEPKTRADEEKLAYSLEQLEKEDPSFKVRTDEETGQTIVSGMGELHLEILVERLKREFKVEANTGQPQVSYRETFAKPIRHEHKYVKQTGGKGMYGHVVFEIEPLETGSGIVFEEKIKGGVVPLEYFNSIKKGVDIAANSGVLGSPLVNLKVTLVDGSYHSVDSSEMAFKLAAMNCIREAEHRAGVKVLEPVMAVEVVVPEQYMGDIIGNLKMRRGEVKSMEDNGVGSGVKVIKAEVPLSEMFGYSTILRSKTQGRGTYTMQFALYKELPENIKKKIFGITV
jgi:elongation factor G